MQGRKPGSRAGARAAVGCCPASTAAGRLQHTCIKFPQLVGAFAEAERKRREKRERQEARMAKFRR